MNTSSMHKLETCLGLGLIHTKIMSLDGIAERSRYCHLEIESLSQIRSQAEMPATYSNGGVIPGQFYATSKLRKTMI